MKFLNNIAMKPKLIGLFLLIGLFPLAVATAIGIWRAGDAIQAQAFEMLTAVNASKKNQIEAYFMERQGDLESLNATVLALQKEATEKLAAVQANKSRRLEDYFDRLSSEMHDLDSNPDIRQVLDQFQELLATSGNRWDPVAWRAVEQSHRARLQEMADDHGWSDLFLLHTDGRIIFSLQQDVETGASVAQEPLHGTGLGLGYRELQGMEQDEIFLADFASFVDDTFAAFMMSSVYDTAGTRRGYVAFRIPIHHINAIVQDRVGLGVTGETYLMGRTEDGSGYRNDRIVKSGALGESRSGGYVDLGLDGQTGIRTDIGSTGDLEYTAFAPLDLPGLNWGIYTTMAVEEILVPTLTGESKDFFASYIESYGYYDLFLVDSNGYVFYSVMREEDYETSLVDGPYKDTNVASLVRQVLKTKAYGLADFAPYAPSDNKQAAFAAQPILDNEGNIEFVVAVQLPHEGINAMMQERAGMGETGETYLIGQQDGVTAFRSNLLTTGGGAHVIGVEVHTDYTAAAAAGQTGQMNATDTEGTESMVVYQPLEIGGLDWAIIGKIRRSELLEPIDQLRNMLIMIAIGIAVLVAVIALFFATSLANPMQLIAQGAERLAIGDAELRGMDRHAIEQINARGDELGMVGRAFERLRGYFTNGATAMQRIAEGDLSVEVTPAGPDDLMGRALVTMKESIATLAVDVNTLIAAAVAGRLETRADTGKFRGEYFAIVQGINATLDAVIGPLNIASGYVDQIARGIIPEPITTVYQGDFEILKANLNILSAQLREMLGGIQQAAGDLNAAAAEILAATTQQAAGATEQSASITQTSTTVDEVKVISEQAIARAREVSDSSRRTIEVSRTGRSSVEETITSMNQIKERVEGIAENILALSDKTQQIGEITATVNDIASQSNMLALNASVEAARAGEHGKGFAVVAAEVRSLAEQSKRATAQVRTILNDIQNAINASVMVTEEGTKVVDDGVNRAAQAREAIEQLASVITQSAQVAGQVAAGGQQQASGVEQIALAMTNIQQAMQQNLASTRQAESAAQNLNALARTLNDTVRQYTIEGSGHNGNGHRDNPSRK